jgi:hypothetical protein
MIAILLLLVLAVIGTSAGMLYWFFRRLQKIETELWGKKRDEAAETAASSPIVDEEQA